MQQLAPSASALDRPFVGLWSLWDMLEVKGKQFFDLLARVETLEKLIGTLSKRGNRRTALMADDTKQIGPALRPVASIAAALGARTASATLKDLAELIEKGRVTYGGAAKEFSTFRTILERELRLSLFLIMAPEDSSLYHGSVAAFGDRATKAFPSILPEVDEAGKCLASGRAAATIFHLMRVTEIALRSLAKPLKLAEPNPSWNTVIRKLDKEIKAAPKDRTLKDADYVFLAGVSAQMHAVNRAWRTRAMHVDATFSLENARDIFNATKALMQHLATQLSESSTWGDAPPS